jgi:hypothetical protein
MFETLRVCDIMRKLGAAPDEVGYVRAKYTEIQSAFYGIKKGRYLAA